MDSELENQKAQFFHNLQTLNQVLAQQDTDFFGHSMSIADVVYFCEIQTILTLLKRQINQSEMPALYKWYNTGMKEGHPVFKEMEECFIKTLAMNQKSHN